MGVLAFQVYPTCKHLYEHLPPVLVYYFDNLNNTNEMTVFICPFYGDRHPFDYSL